MARSRSIGHAFKFRYTAGARVQGGSGGGGTSRDVKGARVEPAGCVRVHCACIFAHALPHHSCVGGIVALLTMRRVRSLPCMVKDGHRLVVAL